MAGSSMRGIQMRSGAAVLMTLVFITFSTGLAGCSRIRDVKGFVEDDQLIQSLQTGVDNKTSVQKTLGRPTIVSEIDPNTWFYVSQKTRQFAFLKPTPEMHKVLVLSFDAKGNLSKVQKIGREQIVNIQPVQDKTPTRGKETGFWDQLLGDVGKFGPTGGDGGNPR